MHNSFNQFCPLLCLLFTCKQTLIFTNLFIIQIVPGSLHKHVLVVSFAQNLLSPSIFLSICFCCCLQRVIEHLITDLNLPLTPIKIYRAAVGPHADAADAAEARSAVAHPASSAPSSHSLQTRSLVEFFSTWPGGKVWGITFGV